jgi:hypothetical protein
VHPTGGGLAWTTSCPLRRLPYCTSCRYDVYLFSKPDTLLAWASLPVVKVMQIRYVLDSLRALGAAVQSG